MYVIVDIAGQQFKVEKDQKIFVNRLEGEAGTKVDFDQILLVDDNGKIQVGTPVVKNMVVSTSIIEHLQGDKVKVFKKKRRKGYQKMNGHRQALTQILIENIGVGEVRPKEVIQKETKPKATKVQKESAEAVTVAKPKAVVKKVAEKKVAEKKVAEKKAKPEAKAKKATETKKAAAPKKPVAKSAAPKAKKVTKKDSKE
jgi:large subunit ribosomal protein L21